MKPILIIIFSIFTICASAQKDTIQIKTTAQCEMCKTTIEKRLYSSKGIKMVNLDLETNIHHIVTVFIIIFKRNIIIITFD